MATEHEYTAQLRAKINPLITGVGPIEAAIALGATLGRLAAGGNAPNLIVSLGSAGSPTLDHARIYQASTVSYRDMDCSRLGFERGVTPFSTEPRVLPLGLAIPGIPSATLSSGAAIISGADYDGIDAEMVDMETYAYARAARLFGVPLISLRGISDGHAPVADLPDWTHALEEIGSGLAAALDHVTAAIHAGWLKESA
jgi:adenosylhomocysteine nucleosidase